MSNKIDQLTPEQEDLLAVYRDKWIKIGLTCGPCDRESVTANVRKMYTEILEREEPKAVIFMPSPYSAWIATCLVAHIEAFTQAYNEALEQNSEEAIGQIRAALDQEFDQLHDQESDNMYDLVRKHLLAQAVSQMPDGTMDQLLDKAAEQIYKQACEQEMARMHEQVLEQINTQVLEQVQRLIWPYPYGQLDAGWMAWRDYMEQVLNIDLAEDVLKKWYIYRDTCHAGPIWALKDVCIVSDRPDRIEMEDGRLHCDGGPAIAYSDGFHVWSLHGVRVSQEIAETPADELDPRLALDTDLSVDVRREVILKIGAERTCEKLGATTVDTDTIIDEEGTIHQYELLELDLDTGQSAKALKMNNPSLPGVVHIEYVHRDCTTVQHALLWREGEDNFQNAVYTPPTWIR